MEQNNYKIIAVLLLLSVYLPTAHAVSRWGSDLHSAYFYHNNVFKLADENEAQDILGANTMDDYLWMRGASLDAELDYQQQNAQFELGWDRLQYSRFSFLDNDALRISTRWRGQVYGPLVGKIDYSLRDELADYAELDEFRDIRFMRQQNNIAAQLQVELGGSWRLGSRISGSDTAFRQDYRVNIPNVKPGSQLSNRQFLSSSISLDFIRGEQREISLVTSVGSLRFQQDTDTNKDRDSQVYDVYTRIKWAIAGHTGIDMRLGGRYREFPASTRANVLGLVGEVRAIWAPTEKYRFSAVYRHDRDAVEYHDADYATINETVLVSELKMLHNFELRLLSNARWHRFDGASSQTGNRQDFVGSGQFELLYVFRTYLQLGSYIKFERRFSTTTNTQNHNYESAVAGLNVSLIYK
ncbi:MAG: hypothetical protein OEZ43_20130 [Gammaproteobacteria bacterium]|nr:hypothetical protein [Gammaproteobacteria bacterium]